MKSQVTHKYTLRRSDGLIFNGNRCGKRFSKIGQSFLTKELLEHEISKSFTSQKQIEILSECKVFKEVSSVTTVETLVQANLKGLQEKLFVKNNFEQRLKKAKIDYRHVWDLRQLFPLWEIDEYSHALMVDFSDSNARHLRDPVAVFKEALKSIGLKRTRYKVTNSVVVLKDEKDAMLARLAIKVPMIYYNLGQI